MAKKKKKDKNQSEGCYRREIHYFSLSGKVSTFLYISITRFNSGFANGRNLILANSF